MAPSPLRKYIGSAYSQEEADYGAYFPEDTLDPFIDAVKKIAGPAFAQHIALEQKGLVPSLNRHRLLIPGPIISWHESCDLVVQAFTDFDPQLGRQAQDAIQNPERWILKQTTPGEAGGRCCNRNTELNGKDFAVIEYQYDQTISDAVYIAHELGHLFAFDALTICADNYPRAHMSEVQAHFTQNILYHHLLEDNASPLQNSVTAHYIGEMTRNLYNIAIGMAVWLEERENAGRTFSGHRYEMVMQDWLGEQWLYFAPAKRVHDRIEDAGIRKNGGFHSLHYHAMGGLISEGLYGIAAKTAAPHKRELLDSLFLTNSGKDFSFISAQFGIQSTEQAAQLASDAVMVITAPLLRLQIA